MRGDLEAMKDSARDEWSRGDYAQLAKLLEGAARELCDACAISAGQAVLDVAAGNGNVAVLAAREGARVVACDLTTAMVEQGRARSEAEGLEVEWLVADAEELPFEDASFDCVATGFGAMFAPRPERAAAEMVRVLRPGGTLGMANWTSAGYMGRSFAIGRHYRPPPDGVPPASDWGDAELLERRLGSLGLRLELERRTVPFEFESREALRAFFGRNVGPCLALRDSLPAEHAAAMGEETMQLMAEHNRATDGSLLIEAEYMLVVGRRRG